MFTSRCVSFALVCTLSFASVSCASRTFSDKQQSQQAETKGIFSGKNLKLGALVLAEGVLILTAVSGVRKVGRVQVDLSKIVEKPELVTMAEFRYKNESTELSKTPIEEGLQSGEAVLGLQDFSSKKEGTFRKFSVRPHEQDEHMMTAVFKGDGIVISEKQDQFISAYIFEKLPDQNKVRVLLSDEGKTSLASVLSFSKKADGRVVVSEVPAQASESDKEKEIIVIDADLAKLLMKENKKEKNFVMHKLSQKLEQNKSVDAANKTMSRIAAHKMFIALACIGVGGGLIRVKLKEEK